MFVSVDVYSKGFYREQNIKKLSHKTRFLLIYSLNLLNADYNKHTCTRLEFEIEKILSSIQMETHKSLITKQRFPQFFCENNN